MLKAKDLQITFNFSNVNIINIAEKLRIADVLEDKFILQVATALRNLNITSVNQLINKEDNKMIL